MRSGVGGVLVLLSLTLVSLIAAEKPTSEASGNISDLMEMSLEQLLNVRVERVYGASRYEQDVEQAPSAVSIVTRDEIQKQGHRTIAEVLQSSRGIFVTSDRVYSYVGVRGFGRPSDYNSRLLVLIDGHRVN